jgi:hypothetical protein
MEEADSLSTTRQANLTAFLEIIMRGTIKARKLVYILTRFLR